MPSDRSTDSDFGLSALAFSHREMLSALPWMPAAHPVSAAANPAAAKTRIARIPLLLLIRIQHVFEPHPLGVEVQIHVPGPAISILAHQEFRGPRDVAGRLIHVF